MQRQASTSRAIEPPQTSQHRMLISPRRKMEDTADLPLYNRNPSVNKEKISRSRLAENLVHLIPLVVLFCLFILWWFSHPVNLEGKNERITAAHQLMTQNTTLLHISFPPSPSISEMRMIGNDGVAE